MASPSAENSTESCCPAGRPLCTLPACLSKAAYSYKCPAKPPMRWTRTSVLPSSCLLTVSVLSRKPPKCLQGVKVQLTAPVKESRSDTFSGFRGLEKLYILCTLRMSLRSLSLRKVCSTALALRIGVASTASRKRERRDMYFLTVSGRRASVPGSNGKGGMQCPG